MSLESEVLCVSESVGGTGRFERRRRTVRRALVISLLQFGLAASVCADDLEAVRAAAEQGDAEAQSRLGAMYYAGVEVPADFDEALSWFRLATDQGFAEAQFTIGSMYFSSEGVPVDEALKWYRQAAAQGHPKAQLGLGTLYFAGLGVPEDPAEAGEAASGAGRVAGSTSAIRHDRAPGNRRLSYLGLRWRSGHLLVIAQPLVSRR